MERRGFALGRLLHQTVEFRGRGLVETGLVFQLQKPHRLEQAKRAHCIDISRVFRRFEADSDMRLCPEIIDLVGLDLGQDAREIRAVRQIAIVKLELGIVRMGIAIDMIHSLRIEE